MAWQKAYLATAVVAGETVDDAMRALSDADRAEVTSLATELSSENRASRAKALAAELAKVARALEELELGRA